MMPTIGTEYGIALVSAFWLGILTSISPCPLATNVAAISFVSRNSKHHRAVLLSGFLYAMGRMLAYVLLGVILIKGVFGTLLSIPDVSFFLQKTMHLILGPLLILVGMILLELLSFPMPNLSKGDKLKKRLSENGIWGAAALGFLFALAFCPVSAALYFGSLIPLAIQQSSPIGLTALYGLGSAIPVLLFALVLVSGSKAVAQAFDRVTAVEKWIRITTGAVILLIGIYFCVTYIFEIF